MSSRKKRAIRSRQAQVRLDRARALLVKGEPAQALEELAQGVALAPSDVELLKRHLSTCLALELPEPALVSARALRKVDPLSSEFAYMFALAAMAAGDLGPAKEALREALGRAPWAWEVRHALSRVHALEGERAQALEVLEEAVRQAPTEPGPANDLAQLYLEDQAPAKAQAVLAEVLGAHPEDGPACLSMALCLLGSDPARARTFAQRAAGCEDAEVSAHAQRLLSGLS